MPERPIYTKDQKTATRAEVVRKPPVKKPVATSGRPIETILTGTWNAVKKPPEWLGKKTVDLYDKFRFPKMTPEEKKMQDKLHAMLKKHYKAVGWVETGVAATVVGFVVARGLRLLRNRRRADVPISIPSRLAPDVAKLHARMQEQIVEQLRGSEMNPEVPAMFADMLTSFVIRQHSGDVAADLERARTAATHGEQTAHLRSACLYYLNARNSQISGVDENQAFRVSTMGALLWDFIGYIGAERFGVTLLPNVENA